jgi:hypothetical protein
MELIERIPLAKINYLYSLGFKTLKDLDVFKNCKNEEERKIQFKIIKSFCETNQKTRGETKRIYSYTEKMTDVGGSFIAVTLFKIYLKKLEDFF